jgi:hypothetical protein
VQGGLPDKRDFYYCESNVFEHLATIIPRILSAGAQTSSNISTGESKVPELVSFCRDLGEVLENVIPDVLYTVCPPLLQGLKPRETRLVSLFHGILSVAKYKFFTALVTRAQKEVEVLSASGQVSSPKGFKLKGVTTAPKQEIKSLFALAAALNGL